RRKPTPERRTAAVRWGRRKPTPGRRTGLRSMETAEAYAREANGPPFDGDCGSLRPGGEGASVRRHRGAVARVPARLDAELLHLRVERAAPDPERTRGRGAIAAGLAERLADPPGLGPVHPAPQREPRAFGRELAVEGTEELRQLGLERGARDGGSATVRVVRHRHGRRTVQGVFPRPSAARTPAHRSGRAGIGTAMPAP